ncbi:MAG: hypothetical protein ABI551_25260 [Polyangiaceae bacterium]
MPQRPQKPQQPNQNPLKQGEGKRHSPQQGPNIGAPGVNDLGGRPNDNKPDQKK